MEISCLLSSIIFLQYFYLVLDKDIAARPPYYRWLKIGNLNWIMVISLEPLPSTWARPSIPHGLLIVKLHVYWGISSCKLLGSYLHNKYQRVKIKDIRSDWLIMNRRVPQGSILGLLQLNVFINYMLFLNNYINIYNYIDDNCTSYDEKNVLQIKIILDKEINKMMD